MPRSMGWRRLAALIQLVCLFPSGRTIDDTTFIPPGVEDLGEEEQLFGIDWEFAASPRMHGRRLETINVVNDWHYAMMNDIERNEAFYEALKEVVTPRSVVLDIGAGSGLLSLMAASLGASSVLAVEGNKDIAALAQAVVERNRHSVSQGGAVKVVNQLSADVVLDDDPADPHRRKANLVVSEIIGTLLLGESQLDYIEDARNRLLTPDATILPAGGIQYATLIQSFDYANLTGVSSWRGFDLGPFNELKDTDSLLKSKQVGIRIADFDIKELATPINLLEVNFYTDTMSAIYPKHANVPRKFTVKVEQAGTVHAVVAYFDLFVDKQRRHVVSTHPARTSRNRDMAWGQQIQSVEDWRLVKHGRAEGEAPQPPQTLVVERGDVLDVEAYYGVGGLGMQFRVSSRPKQGANNKAKREL